VDIGSAESIEEMLERAEELDALKTGVEGLEAQVDAYRGLPADREAARKEVGRLEVELDGVRKRRDALFEGLVGR
jgi:HAUS augmin-like complex subunit 1